MESWNILPKEIKAKPLLYSILNPKTNSDSNLFAQYVACDGSPVFRFFGVDVANAQESQDNEHGEFHLDILY